MIKSLRVRAFEKAVKNKFDVYNSLFLNLPFRKVSNIGMLIPLLQKCCQKGLTSESEPQEIMNAFFKTHAGISSEEEKIDFMFRVIQYIERQIVLYDSVEDAAFPELTSHGEDVSLKDFIHVAVNKKDVEELAKELNNFRARIVFTAHPTQFYTPAVLDIIGRLRSLIDQNDINGIDITLQQLGLTSLVNTKKPTPFDEARNIIYFLRNVYYDAVGDLYASIKRNIPDGAFDNPEIIQLGFWPGGDRDGNPYVTSDVTLAVADELRLTLMKCYYQDVKNLERKLTFREVEDIVSDLRAKLYPVMFDPGRAMSFEDIINPLYKIRQLITEKYNSLYLEDLDALIDKVKIFRTHFAVLDIRQNHDVHEQAVEQILNNENRIKHNLDELTRDELIGILIHENFDIDPEKFEDDIIRDTLRLIGLLGDIQEKNGSEGCNRYIISHSENIFSVLFVFALFRWCGWNKGRMPFDFVPLFESMEGMKHAGSIMNALFEIPQYRDHLKNRHDKQTMMLGFSDGTKDGGYLKANWSIFKTKETLTEVCDQHDVKAIFFDGRGGPPARGGGKTHRFYAAQTNRIANHAIQLTIQGQTITSKYGTTDHFRHNCEQLLTAGLSNRLASGVNEIPGELRNLIEELGMISFEKYNQLKNHEMFVPYLERKSALRFYGETNIASRPTKRGNKGGLALEDLRAIPFVGAWSQLRQNVPGYYGIGTALKSLIDDGKSGQLKALFKDVPFFRAMILNSMMALKKCNFALTAYIAKDKAFTEFWNLLYDEYKLAKEMMLHISGLSGLMAEEPISRNSVEIRERIVLPLLVIQQYALQKIEQNTDKKEIYEKIVRRSLYGNINASRNSA